MPGQRLRFGENRCSDSAPNSRKRVPSTGLINGMVSESQGEVYVSCAFLRGKPGEVKDPLFFEPPSRGLPGIEEGALIFLSKVFLVCPILRGWWKELRDTLQGDSWTSLKTTRPCLLLLRDPSGHLIGMNHRTC